MIRHRSLILPTTGGTPYHHPVLILYTKPLFFSYIVHFGISQAFTEQKHTMPVSRFDLIHQPLLMVAFCWDFLILLKTLAHHALPGSRFIHYFLLQVHALRFVFQKNRHTMSE
jgi:hypothetical protein